MIDFITAPLRPLYAIFCEYPLLDFGSRPARFRLAFGIDDCLLVGLPRDCGRHMRIGIASSHGVPEPA